ncbi:MAG: ABC transporter permease [Candidatus Omnitrophota bacterium]
MERVKRGFVDTLGHRLLAFIHFIGSLALILIKVITALLTGRLRLVPFLQECDIFGNRSFWIVALLSFFFGMVVAMQSATPLKLTGGEIYVSTIVTLSAVRELGPILVAFLISGRVGSAIAAEIGTMKITEQIDALNTLAVDPVEYLVVPKFAAGCLMLPVLTVMAVTLQILGGYVIGTTTLNLNTSLFFFQAFRFVFIKDIMIGLLKALIFGAIIVVVSSREGFFAEGGAKGVGRATTLAVVISLFMVIVADFVITALFYFI